MTRTSRNFRFGSEADITRSPSHVRFTPESGHRARQRACPLSAINGHQFGLDSTTLYDFCVVIMYPNRLRENVWPWEDQMSQICRRTVLGAAAAMVTTSAFAEGCQVGPPQHHKGPPVFMDYDQLELDGVLRPGVLRTPSSLR